VPTVEMIEPQCTVSGLRDFRWIDGCAKVVEAGSVDYSPAQSESALTISPEGAPGTRRKLLGFIRPYLLTQPQADEMIQIQQNVR
jgi:hypothetical protein